MVVRRPARSGDALIGRLVALSSELELDPDDFVLFGSAPMLAYGIRETIQDLDIVARGRTWKTVSRLGERSAGTVSGDPVYLFDEGRIQFSNQWISSGWDTDELIDRAEIIGGLRFARLSDVLRYKQELLRPKDLADIELLRRATPWGAGRRPRGSWRR